MSGAPEICPNFLQTLGVIMSYTFVNCGSGVSVEEWNETTAKLKIFPNPGMDYFDFALPGLSVKEIQWWMRSVSGLEVAKGRWVVNGGRVDVSHIPPGVYMIECRSGGKSWYTRWVKQF
ncbi:MAG: T9SS C-terminal target domain-containing protein [Chitinophagia bacterium]|nr:T9SS C-terminal target domain-containing protein [Chitinophagia bacterium]